MLRSFPLLMVAALGVLGCMGCPRGSAVPEGAPEVGDRAPEFPALAELRARGPVLVWFTNLCETCRTRGGRIQSAAEASGSSAIAVTPPELTEEARAAFDALSSFRSPKVIDRDGFIRKAYRSPVSPDT